MSVNKKDKKTQVSYSKTFKKLYTFIKPYRKRLFASLFFIFLATLANAMAPFVLGKATDALANIVVDGVEIPQALTTFFLILGVLALVYILYAIFNYLSTWIMVGVTERTIFDLRKRVDFKLSKLPLNYYDTNAYGDILSRVTNDVDTISTSLQQSIAQIATTVFTVIFIFIMMMFISPLLTFVGIGIVPFALYLAMKLAKRSQKYFDNQQENIGELNGYVEEYYGGHNVTAAFGKEEDVIEDFEVTNQNLFSNAWKGQFFSGTLMPITQGMTNFGYAAVAIVGGILAVFGGISIGMIQSFTQYLRQFSQPITQVLQITNIIQSTVSAVDRIFEFLEEKEEVADTQTPRFPEKLAGKVEFDHIRFGYLPHQTLIHDLNITIQPGSKTAIVGPTGAGKTTLVNLIMRFYDVNGGAIRIDGIDIRDMQRARLRDIFGMVLQDTWLYSGTIRENIRYGRLNATDEEVEQAAKDARADAFIRTLPGGYDFVLHEGASNIAQGQRQLLTIARAMLANPPIMILDEATSSVDTRTELLIQEAMNAMMKGRTSFVIAHRLSTIKDAENILYMQDGDILEVGTHNQLMEKNGLYAKLYNSQFAQNNG
ncbi:MAG: ABC transporter ATP-binding protein [Acutalibacteraceae bacterium]|nr:ABC transporter ATP-binding protein [Acutalibacteraceae bacterium]HIR02998.1 ABC transporter ATP-binding protein [Candidatus Scatovicinus merdipullorum]